jgi:hypothetical protein
MPDRVIVLANALVQNARRCLPREVRYDSRYARDVLVIAPILATRLQSLTSDVDAAYQAAQQRMEQIAADMSRFRTAPRTTVGDENQLLAIEDAMTAFHAEAVVVITRSDPGASYREHRISNQIHEHFKLPVSTLTVDADGVIVNYCPSQ